MGPFQENGNKSKAPTTQSEQLHHSVHSKPVVDGWFSLCCQCRLAGRHTAYNWLTGSSVDTLADYMLGSESLSSSLLVYGSKRPERRQAARRPVGEGFGTRRLTVPADEGDSRSRGQCRMKERGLSCSVCFIFSNGSTSYYIH